MPSSVISSRWYDWQAPSSASSLPSMKMINITFKYFIMTHVEKPVHFSIAISSSISPFSFSYSFSSALKWQKFCNKPNWLRALSTELTRLLKHTYRLASRFVPFSDFEMLLKNGSCRIYHQHPVFSTSSLLWNKSNAIDRLFSNVFTIFLEKKASSLSILSRVPWVWFSQPSPISFTLDDDKALP